MIRPLYRVALLPSSWDLTLLLFSTRRIAEIVKCWSWVVLIHSAYWESENFMLSLSKNSSKWIVLWIMEELLSKITSNCPFSVNFQRFLNSAFSMFSFFAKAVRPMPFTVSEEFASRASRNLFQFHSVIPGMTQKDVVWLDSIPLAIWSKFFSFKTSKTEKKKEKVKRSPNSLAKLLKEDLFILKPHPDFMILTSWIMILTGCL